MILCGCDGCQVSGDPGGVGRTGDFAGGVSAHGDRARAQASRMLLGVPIDDQRCHRLVLSVVGKARLLTGWRSEPHPPVARRRRGRPRARSGHVCVPWRCAEGLRGPLVQGRGGARRPGPFLGRIQPRRRPTWVGGLHPVVRDDPRPCLGNRLVDRRATQAGGIGQVGVGRAQPCVLGAPTPALRSGNVEKRVLTGSLAAAWVGPHRGVCRPPHPTDHPQSWPRSARDSRSPVMRSASGCAHLPKPRLNVVTDHPWATAPVTMHLPTNDVPPNTSSRISC
jgi:hypothetical protein